MNQNIVNQLNIDLPPPVPGKRSVDQMEEEEKEEKEEKVITETEVDVRLYRVCCLLGEEVGQCDQGVRGRPGESGHHSHAGHPQVLGLQSSQPGRQHGLSGQDSVSR